MSWPYFPLIWGVLYGEVVLDWIGLTVRYWWWCFHHSKECSKAQTFVSATQSARTENEVIAIFTYTVKQLIVGPIGYQPVPGIFLLLFLLLLLLGPVRLGVW